MNSRGFISTVEGGRNRPGRGHAVPAGAVVSTGLATMLRPAGLLAVALALLPLACSRGPQAPVLATVGERQITTEDFKQEIERRRAARRPIPDKQTLLQEMVDAEALVQRARAAGLLGDPQVQREINSFLIAELKARELAPREKALTVTPEEIKAEYERNLGKYTHPAKIRLAVLALADDPKMSEARRAELRQRMAEARRKYLAASAAAEPAPNPGFGPLAIDFSDDPASRYRGGDIGWLEEGNFASRWPREVLATGYALEKNQVSELIEAQNGVYLVMKTDSRPGSTDSLATVEGRLRQAWLAQKRRALELDFLAEAVRAARATIHTQALAAVQLQLSPLAASRRHDPQPPAYPMGPDSRKQASK